MSELLHQADGLLSAKDQLVACLERQKQTAAERDRLVKVGKEFYDAVALGPLDAAAAYGPDFDLNEHLKAKAAEFRAALAEARQS